jgi:hypothetical protein
MEALMAVSLAVLPFLLVTGRGGGNSDEADEETDEDDDTDPSGVDELDTDIDTVDDLWRD